MSHESLMNQCETVWASCIFFTITILGLNHKNLRPFKGFKGWCDKEKSPAQNVVLLVAMVLHMLVCDLVT